MRRDPRLCHHMHHTAESQQEVSEGGCYSGMWDGGGKVMSHTCVLLLTNSSPSYVSSLVLLPP